MTSVLSTRAFRPLFLVTLISCCVSSSSGSQCDEEEVASCKQAATTGSLQSFHGGGNCSEQSYTHFTHGCLLTSQAYDPTVSLCCCVSDRRIMCCKYQQSWNHFRCSQPDDTVDNISPWSRPPGSSSPLKTPPLHILIPVIVIPLLLIGCCIVCLVKYCRCHRAPHTKARLCGWSCCGKSKQSKTPPRASRPVSSGPADSVESQRHVVTSQYSTESRGSEAKLLPDEVDNTSVSQPYSDRPTHAGGYLRLCSSQSAVLDQIPEHPDPHTSAATSRQLSTDSQSRERKVLPNMDDPVATATAPLREEDIDFTCPEYSAECQPLHSQSSVLSGPNQEQRGRGGEVFIQNAGETGRMVPRVNRTPSVGYMCPPPAYDEHHKDPVLHI